jgi:hypothetical protein
MMNDQYIANKGSEVYPESPNELAQEYLKARGSLFDGYIPT